jgi:hypothetical protein
MPSTAGHAHGGNGHDAYGHPGNGGANGNGADAGIPRHVVRFRYRESPDDGFPLESLAMTWGTGARRPRCGTRRAGCRTRTTSTRASS